MCPPDNEVGICNNCILKPKVDGLGTSIGVIGIKVERLEISVRAISGKVDKIDKMDRCLEKIDQTLHGDSEIGFNGLIKSQKESKKEIKAINELMWFPRLADDFWKSVKKPLYWIILIAILGFASAILTSEFWLNLLNG